VRPDRLDDNRSCWLAELPSYDPLPAAAGDLSADVVIIGGGLTGVSTAWHLSERFPARRIALLEAKTLANGASGRNGGQVLNGVAGVDPVEPEPALRLYATTRRGIDIVEQLAAQATLPTGFARHGCLQIYTTARAADAAQARIERNRAWGIPVRWLPGDAGGAVGAHGAALDPTAGRINAAALVRGLRAPLLARGVAIHEHTPVLRIEEGRSIALTLPAGRARAAAVVLATDAYTPLLGYFRTGILPLHSHLLATEPLSATRWAALGWGEPYGFEGFADDLDRIAYGCRTPGGRLLFGGGGNHAYDYYLGGTPVGPDPARRGGAFAAIERQLHQYFPGLGDAPITHRWSGTLGMTLDRVCSIGVTGAHRNIYYAVGYSGHGLALAALAGCVLADLYAGEHEPWRELPFYQRRLPYIPPEPLRWLGYQLYSRATGRSPRRAWV
jgi:glycine/D-amino acid oxidase-like deaminating enzyme